MLLAGCTKVYRIASCSANIHSLLTGFILSSHRATSLPQLPHNRMVKCSETLKGSSTFDFPRSQTQ